MTEEAAGWQEAAAEANMEAARAKEEEVGLVRKVVAVMAVDARVAVVKVVGQGAAARAAARVVAVPMVPATVEVFRDAVATVEVMVVAARRVAASMVAV